MRADIAILGGGVIGASVAHHLAARGLDVLVLDRAPALGGGSTARATGGFRAQFDNETEVRLSLLSRAKLLEFEAETGVDPGYAQRGYLFLACSEVVWTIHIPMGILGYSLLRSLSPPREYPGKKPGVTISCQVALPKLK